jgi:acid phosphatase type 7
MGKTFCFVFVLLWSGLMLGCSRPMQEPTLAQTDDPVLVGAGDIARCKRTQDEATAQLLDSMAGTIFTLGDNVYPDGTLTQFNDCFAPNWGRHKQRMRPAAGNHDYHVTGAEGYYTYFGAAASPLDNDCTSHCKGYYSYDLGAWHIIVLNSEIDRKATSAQVQWLRADLAANPRLCTLAYWHRPRFSSARHGNTPAVKPFWEVLYTYGADVVLSGHDHSYERFAPQNPDGEADPTRGIRQFVVGTGGAGLYDFDFATLEPNSEVRNNSAHGVLKLTLHPTSYDWEFVPVAGQSFTDAGSAKCVSIEAVPTATLTNTRQTPTNIPEAPTNTPEEPTVTFTNTPLLPSATPVPPTATPVPSAGPPATSSGSTVAGAGPA